MLDTRRALFVWQPRGPWWLWVRAVLVRSHSFWCRRRHRPTPQESVLVGGDWSGIFVSRCSFARCQCGAFCRAEYCAWGSAFFFGLCWGFFQLCLVWNSIAPPSLFCTQSLGCIGGPPEAPSQQPDLRAPVRSRWISNGWNIILSDYNCLPFFPTRVIN